MSSEVSSSRLRGGPGPSLGQQRGPLSDPESSLGTPRGSGDGHVMGGLGEKSANNCVDFLSLLRFAGF